MSKTVLFQAIQFILLFVWVYGISNSVGNLIPNPFLYKRTVILHTIQFSISTYFNCQEHFTLI